MKANENFYGAACPIARVVFYELPKDLDTKIRYAKEAAGDAALEFSKAARLGETLSDDAFGQQRLALEKEREVEVLTAIKTFIQSTEFSAAPCLKAGLLSESPDATDEPKQVQKADKPESIYKCPVVDFIRFGLKDFLTAGQAKAMEHTREDALSFLHEYMRDRLSEGTQSALRNARVWESEAQTYRNEGNRASNLLSGRSDAPLYQEIPCVTAGLMWK